MPMPNAVKQFPRGYSGGQVQTGPTHETREGDREITRLYEASTQPHNQSATWTFRRQVIAAAKRLLGTDRPNWFLTQDGNPLVQAYNYQFILDTLRFIGTGRRRISIYAWPDLLSNHPDQGLDDISERNDIAQQFRELGVDLQVESLIQLWCQHRGGFDDMLCTLYLLFGDLPVRVEREDTTA